MVIDGVVARLTAGRRWLDRNGRMARRGRPDATLVRELLRHPFLARRPPKSTGREDFGAPFVERLLAAGRRRRLRPDDLVATATAFTAAATADAYRRFLPRVDEVLVAGGGSRNPALVDALSAALPGADVGTVDAHGIDADALEAYAFALLAWAAATGRAASLPAVTGARRAEILGHVVPGRRFRGLAGMV
jgi:anhydro-N-acetylmuramic acid kinase